MSGGNMNLNRMADAKRRNRDRLYIVSERERRAYSHEVTRETVKASINSVAVTRQGTALLKKLQTLGL